jgi:glyoxylase-like metal-dependent hydrolase (beta-lactamase superfamily II)
MSTGVWEAYALRYARHDRLARENFLGGDPHDNSPMPMDYFIWVVKSPERLFVIDTGFDKSSGDRRGRESLRSPADGLKSIGIDPLEVKDVIISHMHYDHCGNHDLCPNAIYHLQDREIQYCTGRHMTHPYMRFPFDEEDVIAMVRRIYHDRVVFHSGDEELAPGLSVHHVGGHSMGLQMVRVWTRRGWVVLATDAAHYYENIERDLAYPFLYNLGEVLEGYRRARALADSPDHIVPGHDPKVLEKYPPPREDLKGWVARLD